MKPLAVAAVLLLACSSSADSTDPGHPAGGRADDVEDPGFRPDGGAASEPLRFVAMGDTGTGDANQRAVAAAVRDTCAARGCDFVALLGDNLYGRGADSVDDPMWQELFEEPYADIDLPFYAVLGNHDYGGKLFGIKFNGLGNQFERGQTEIDYTARSSRWKMPAAFYTLRFGQVGLIALDTNAIMWGNEDQGDQRAWLPGALASMSSATWKIGLGHHPYRSNGKHGNAGEYGGIEGLDIPIPISQINGEEVKEYFDDLVCGSFDVYLSGHDHNRQWLDESARCGGTELIVTGAGGHVTPFAGDDNVTRWQDDEKVGFLYVVVDGPTLTGSFIDSTGAVDFEYTLTK